MIGAKRWSKLLVFGIAGIVLFSSFSCSKILQPVNPTISQLDRMKGRSQRQDYSSLIAEKISCQSNDTGCNQIHLIKGDACFRLAKQGEKKHYQCASDELEEGISQTSAWTMEGLDLNRAQTYENLSESLRNWQDMENGATAHQITQRLLKVTDAFLQAEPGHLAGIYFNAGAQYAMLQKAIIRGEPAVCEELNQIQSLLQKNIDRAKGTRYKENYDRILGDVAMGKQAVPNCT